jgi:transcriptional regulator with XRE-family HTH domain
MKMTTSATFGNAVSQGRKQQKMSQKDLAAQIKREDGVAISAQYLNDIEHDRRSPSSDLMVQQFATILKLDANYLYYLAGKIPAELMKANLSPEQVQKLMVAFRKTLK